VGFALEINETGMRPVKTEIEPISNAVHLCIDMQNIFSKGGLWETPWMERVLPLIVTLAAWKPERTIFTRFITPETPDKRPGRRQKYFHRWAQATRAHLPLQQLNLVPACQVCSASPSFTPAAATAAIRLS
jgi:nicotinamidase-related amidase